MPQFRYWSVFLASLAMGGCLLIFFRGEIQRSNSEHSKTTISYLSAEIYSMQVILRRFPKCAIPVSGASMKFANLHAILDILDRVRPQRVVEFGSGISTICIAAWFKEHGEGALISFDHDNSWGAITTRYLADNALSKFAKVIVAPLKLKRSFGQDVDWYDIDQYLSEISNIDMLIVDGPPALENQFSRLPALEAIHERLKPAAVVIVDDAQRMGERTVVDLWMKSFPGFELRQIDSVTGLAVLEPSVKSHFQASKSTNKVHSKD